MSRFLTDFASFASIAQATYALFDATPSRKAALIGNKTGDFTSAEADRFLGLSPEPNSGVPQGVELRHHHRDDSSGFSASVFFDKAQSKYVLSIRGTAGLVDLLEDVNRIGFQGFAGEQAVSLYRYYRKLTTPAGQPVSYANAEIALLNSLRQAAPLKLEIASLFAPGLRAELARDVGALPLAGAGSSVIPAGTPLVVTGHSLGGHLALLFGRMFPNATEHVYTYNAPGIGAGIIPGVSLFGEGLLRRVGIGPIDPARVTNIASAMASETVSRIWSKPGENIGVFTEAGSALHQHSIVPLTDSLALYGAFATLSPSLSGDPAAVSGIISAASPYSDESLEAVLDALRTTFGVDGEPTLIARSVADVAARDGYYQNLYAMLDARIAGRDYGIESLAGKSAAELASMAAEDVSVRFALDALTPFAAKNADFASFEDAFSGQWLASRAEWLEATLDANQVERPFGLSGTADNVLFRDVDDELRYAKLDGIQGNLALQISALADRSRIETFLDAATYNRAVIFGSDSPAEGDQLTGLSGGDRLFGAGGDDRLDGAGGDDYLEGGAGADALTGGAGDDTLDGGEGADRLEGGPGSDTYRITGSLDADTIVDHDGQIYVDATLLTGGTGGEGGTFRSSDGRFTYEFSGDLASEGTLVANGALRVEGFRNGDLGIRLTRGLELPEPAVPAADMELIGDFEYLSYRASPTRYVTFDQYGNPTPDMIAVPAPGRQDQDWDFPGMPGNMHAALGGGDDRWQGFFGGDDHVELGSGNDAGFGGAGNDLIEGGPGRDLLAGGRGDDMLFAGGIETAAADLEDSAVPTRSDGGDLLSGGDGDDIIIGDAEANLIEGGAGRDQVFGGAGDDWIGSDIAELSRQEVYGYADPHHRSDFGSGPPMLVDFLWRSFPPPAFSLQAGNGFASPGIATIGGTSLNPFFRIQTAGDADEIDAGPGNDTVVAGEGDDLVFGAAGDDYIDAGEGADTVFGGDGDDYVLAYWDAIGDYIDLGDGDDAAQSGAGDDILIGGPGNDWLSSGGGNDILIGGDGDDFLAGIDGGDVLDGGPGDDTYTSFSQPDGGVHIRMGRGYGADLLDASVGAVVVDIAGDVSPGEVTLAQAEQLMAAPEGESGEFATRTGIELRIGAGADSLFLVDGPAEERAALSIEFSDGTVWDDAYIQSVLAPGTVEEPPPAIAGTAAGDLLYGSAGPDAFSSSQGDDWLMGGAGDDVYRYAQGGGFDLIEDSDASPGNADVLRFADGIQAGDVEVSAAGDDYILTSGAGGVRIRGGRAPAGAVERVEFADATAWSAADLEARAQVLPDNRAPQMPALLGSVAVDPGSPVEVTIPANVISDPDRFDSLSYHAVTADGDPLPGWLAFDAASLRFSGTPAAADAGSHQVALIAADANGAASIGSLGIVVGAGGAAQESGIPAAAPAEPAAGIDTAPASSVSTLPRTNAAREETLTSAAPASPPAGEPPRVGVPIDPLYRDMQRRMDVLLQTGRTNLGERYAEAIREFEERRVQREETPPPPPPADEEIEAWNSAMHSWHDRHPGFAETELGGNDGAWTAGWGLPGPGDAFGGGAAASVLPGLASPLAQARLAGAAGAPALAEGLRNPA